MIVIAEQYSVEAYLKATGVKQFAQQFNGISKNLDNVDQGARSAGSSISSMLTTVAGVAAAVGLFHSLANAVDGAVSRYDTLNNFPKVLEQMGFTASESKDAINKLSDGIQGLPTKLDDVAGTAQRIAVLTGNLEGATDTTLALNNAFIASGSNSEDATRGLEQYVQMLSRGEVDLEAWRSLQETMGVALNDTAKAFGYTGSSAQNDLYNALKDGEVTFDEFNNKIIELNNATGGFADRARTASGGIRTAWTNMGTAVVRGVTNIIDSIDEFLAGTQLGSIENIINNIGDSFFNMLDSAANALPKIITFFVNLYNFIKPIIPIVASVVVAFVTFNTIVSITTSVRTAIESLRTAMVTLNATMMANPVALVIGILAGLAVILYTLYQRSETFRNAINLAFAQIRDFVMPIVQVVVNFIKTVWGALVTWWQQNSQMILTTAMTIWNAIWTTISTIVQSIWNFVKQIWSTLTSFWNENGQKIRKASSNIFKAIFTVIKTHMNLIKNIIQVVWPIIQAIFKSAFNIIKTVVSSAWNVIKTLVQGFVDWFLSIIDFWASVFTGDWEGALDAAKDSAKAILDTITGLFGDALDFITGLGGDFLQAGKNIVGSIAKGIKKAAGKVTSAISDVTQKIRNFLPFSPAKEGALRDIMKIQIPQSIAKSIDKGKKVAVRSMSNLSNAINNEMPSANMDIAGQVNRINRNASAQVNSDVNGEVNIGNNRIESLLQKIVDKNQSIVLDTGELVGATRGKYDQANGEHAALSERWVVS
ncbi:tape measure protein [Paraliobacillus ryukyuensis]|uniref:tape measure protein n=1 Tax=Paraliobacillus ryukyuensis TaxID=200904 RepID=UPI0009A8CF65|nr:tape measure protein [Paraliobacillus ryukyuensis]